MLKETKWERNSASPWIRGVAAGAPIGVFHDTALAVHFGP